MKSKIFVAAGLMLMVLGCNEVEFSGTTPRKSSGEAAVSNSTDKTSSYDESTDTVSVSSIYEANQPEEQYGVAPSYIFDGSVPSDPSELPEGPFFSRCPDYSNEPDCPEPSKLQNGQGPSYIVSQSSGRSVSDRGSMDQFLL
ncbi:MAG: hypothetical protein HQK54_06605, partial [Oligoflexales bacterium]|nr:hypothetical protein [Oligoflexales bacterium]